MSMTYWRNQPLKDLKKATQNKYCSHSSCWFSCKILWPLTFRLYLLIKLYGGIAVAEYSSSLTAQQRRAILRDFRAGSVQLLICSDAMARGMDIDSVQYVISYDAPNYAKGYIHRVGRTARAGNKGTVDGVQCWGGIHRPPIHWALLTIDHHEQCSVRRQCFSFGILRTQWLT